MNVTSATQSLEASGQAILALTAKLTPEEARQRHAPGKWSQLEVLCHLLDEERLDFRRRIQLTLEDPAQDWPPNDPEGWVAARKYNEQDLAAIRSDFERERAASLAWLRGLGGVDWSLAHTHPIAGSLRVGDLLASWVAHDQAHLRQIVNVRLALLDAAVAPYSTGYAF